MILTRKKLNEILRNQRTSIPAELKKELLEHYGNPATDDKGRVHEYTEQDICEQLSKMLLHVENSDERRCSLTLI